MLEFIHGIHLIVSLMLLYILLKYYKTITTVFEGVKNSACITKCFSKGSDSP